MKAEAELYRTELPWLHNHIHTKSCKFIKILPRIYDITYYIANIDYMTNIGISYIKYWESIRCHYWKHCNIYNFLDCISLVRGHVGKFCEFSLQRLSLVIIFTDSFNKHKHCEKRPQLKHCCFIWFEFKVLGVQHVTYTVEYAGYGAKGPTLTVKVISWCLKYN